MNISAIVAVLAVALLETSSNALEPPVELQLQLKTSLRAPLNPRFLSVTIDASLASEAKYIAFLGSQKLITLTSGLSPAFLRFGGTKSDFLFFDPARKASTEENITWNFAVKQDVCEGSKVSSSVQQKLWSQWPSKEQNILKEDFSETYKNATITKHTIDLLYRFANCSGLHLIFGLNALMRNKYDHWNSSNAKLLIDYCDSKKYNMSWELGNEPNSFKKKSGVYVNGTQLGKDFITLHDLLSKYSRYRTSGLFGPDIGQPKKSSQKMLKSFLKAGGKFINSVTWHHYYIDGRTASVKDFVNPNVLDTLSSEIKTVLKIVNETVPGKSVWLGETSSAYGGGSPGLSNTFIDGFMWLDKLGLSAKLGIDVVMRQALFGAGSYNLVDSNFEPLPDYWLSLVYKKLVGSIVLNASVRSYKKFNMTNIRLYLHCTNINNPKYKMGDVTLFAINLNNHTQKVHLPSFLSGKYVDQYLLSPGEGGLLSSTILLNGDILKMEDEKTLPDLNGKQLDPGLPLILPSMSFGFFVVKGAMASACL
ncbi:heparanase [Hyla sarda]|uniref:heparanase n=1 Tax=Hyla sarda TaxID=327740 RepID=UPI0024C43FA4|nr:heparanase [Hyla sarda]XP_056424759.1 heparanase [Hyla sarda]XP_056424760.1 heparanase [Hyla sarda]XP_056424761.1 heparanase [Hyla sarda]